MDEAGNAYVTGFTNSVDFPLITGAYQNIPRGGDAFITKISAAGDLLEYSTYLGGTGSDSGSDIVLDGLGNAYISGSTDSTDFPTTPGAYKETPAPGYGAFVTKLNSSGTALEYSTYVVGGGGDYGFKYKLVLASPPATIAVDAGGNAYVASSTSTSGLPTTRSAFQADLKAPGATNVYVMKLNSNGSGIQYATYIGGSVRGLFYNCTYSSCCCNPNAPWPGEDHVADIAVDLSGYAYLVGTTFSDDFPGTGMQTDDCAPDTIEMGYPCSQIFVTKLNPEASGLVYSKSIGGDGYDIGWGLAVDTAGSASVVGQTVSWGFAGPTICDLRGYYSPKPCPDAFVARYDSSGSGIGSWVLGGASYDGGRAIALDESGNVFITGYTESADFPTTGNNFQPYPGGGADAFVSKLSSAGSVLLFSSILGGNLDDTAHGIALDSEQNAYVVLETSSTSFLVTAGSFNLLLGNNGTFRGGTGDVLVGKVSPLDIHQAGVSLISVTFPEQVVGTSSGPVLVTVGNLSNVLTTVSGIDAENTDGTTSTDFTVNPRDCIRIYQPGDRCTFELTFNPQPEVSSQSLSLKSGGEKMPPSAFKPTRIGRCRIRTGSGPELPLQGDAVATGVAVSPSSLSFSRQQLGATSPPQTVTLANRLGSPLTISNIMTNGEFSIQATTCPVSPIVLADGTDCSISVAFTPQGDGTRTGTLTITDNGPGSPRTVALSGLGPSWSVLSVSELAFPAQLVGTSGPAQMITLTNNTDCSFPLANFQTTSSEFSQSTNCPWDPYYFSWIAPGFSCQIYVGFTPRRVGKRMGHLEITSYEIHTVDLFGSGFLYPIPQINQPIAPTTAAPGGSGGSLNISGTGFVSDSVVEWNGSARSTTFVDSTHLPTAIPASDVAVPGTALITVRNPGSGKSNAVSFPIINPKPSITVGRTDYSAPTNPVAVATADFNADGKLDLAVANYVSGTVSIFLGAADGAFQHQGDYSTGSGPTGVATGDFNRDGNIDLAISAGIGVSLLLGNGSGAFQTRVDYEAGDTPSSVTSGDFNADGYLDIAVTNGGSNTVSVLLGYGDATFQGHVDYATGNQPMSVAAADLNKDGILDLAVANQTDNTVSVLPGKGDGTFSPQTTYATGAGPTGIIAADFNVDGRQDLAVANNASDTVSFLLGNGDGTLQGQTESTSGAAPGGLAVGDLNGDGKLDLAVANGGDSTVAVLLGKGDGSFETSAGYATGLNPLSIAVGDFNDDGRLDLVVANRDDNAVSVLLQSSFGTVPSRSIPFSNQLVGTPSSVQTVTATNYGTTSVTISEVSLAGTNATDFAISDDTCSGASLNPNGTCTVGVTFKPTAVGSLDAALTITHSPLGSPYTLSLSGSGVQPGVDLSATTMDFGTQRVGSPSPEQTLDMTNTGNASLSVTGVAITGTDGDDFGLTDTCQPSVPEGEGCTISVTFTPSVRGPRSATLTITSDAPDSPHPVALAGIGIAPALSPSGDNLNFGDQLVGTTSAAQRLMIANAGDATLNIYSADVTAGDFEPTVPPEVIIPVEPGDSHSVDISFAPKAAGTQTGTFTIDSDAPDSPHTVELSGTGTDFAVSVPAGSSTSATVTAGGTATYNLRIAPSGFVGTATLACTWKTPQPRGTSCAVSPASVSLDGATEAPFTVTVTTRGRAVATPMARRAPLRPNLDGYGALSLLVGLLMMLELAQKSRRVKEQLRATTARGPVAAMLLAVLLWAACGGTTPPPTGTPAGTYQLTLTATANGVSRSTPLTLKVN